ncbi:MAG: ATP-dependent protease ATPase subunit HslU [Spirochaetales bacterium]|jgi:ATP-dependent HslUV protease ATP-binding subunit HslU|nr:ATP-dependent protease ATPase subunit HslU [Spirochaetales bacterium]
MKKSGFEELTPRQIVEELDKYIVGQTKAKKAVAIALRNRIRRQRLPQDLRDEVAPKNIIMIGPTGVGKTEIARRISRLTGAPFIKVEATKYTEVGYVGRDVESMVRDLMSVAISMVKNELREEVREEAERRTEEALLDILLPGTRKNHKPPSQEAPRTAEGAGSSAVPGSGGSEGAVITTDAAGGLAASGIIFPAAFLSPQEQETYAEAPAPPPPAPPAGSENISAGTRAKFRKKLSGGELDEKLVEINVSGGGGLPTIEVFSGASFEAMDFNIGGLGNIGNMLFGGGRPKKKKVTVKQAREILLSEEMDKLIDTDTVTDTARERAEQMGIIFIDEIDKIASKEGRSGSGDVSREGVQRDILPIVEGSKVNTKYGMIDTSHILFIAAGAFHISKPSDLIPELQGRFPIRVELEALTKDDFIRILTQPKNALIKQYTELLKTEDVKLTFDEGAVTRLAELAAEVNSRSENIGARRLHTIMELLLEELSFNAPEMTGAAVPVTPQYVDERLKDVVTNQDLSRYIL